MTRTPDKDKRTCSIEGLTIRSFRRFGPGTSGVAIVVSVAVHVGGDRFSRDVRSGGKLAPRVFCMQRELVDLVVVHALDDVL